MKFQFVKSSQKKADHLAKNVSGEIYEAHINDFVIVDQSLITYGGNEKKE